MSTKLKKLIDDERYARDRDADMKTLAVAFFENLERDNCEYGGWGVDSKRPFGNSDVDGDIIDMLFEDDDDKVYNDQRREDEDLRNYVKGLYDDLGEYLKEKCIPTLK